MGFEGHRVDTVYRLITENMEQIYADLPGLRYRGADEKIVTVTFGEYAQDIRRCVGLVNEAQDEKHIAAAGHTIPCMEYKLEDGELCMKGECLMLGYYRNPEATAEAVDAEGWLHTGDLARVDEDGYYTITGRKKNLIILDSGENVSPEELEGLLAGCEAIRECVVKANGKKIGADICCEPGRQEEVRAYITQLNRTLPLYKRITAVDFSEGPLPRNATGKLLRT